MPEITEDDPVPRPVMPIPPRREPGFWNGNRPLIVLMLLMLGSLGVLGIVTIFSVRSLIDHSEPPLIATLPQPVNGENADANAVEDTVHAGDTINLTTMKFNRTDGDVIVVRVDTLVRQDGDGRVPISMSPPTQPWPPGLSTFPATAHIPDTLPPGIWRIEGSDLVLSSSVSTLHIYTESFRVVPKGE